MFRRASRIASSYPGCFVLGAQEATAIIPMTPADTALLSMCRRPTVRRSAASNSADRYRPWRELCRQVADKVN
jgi:hypothetical protein